MPVIQRLSLSLIVLLGLSLSANAGETLEMRIFPLVQAHKGHVTLAVKNLKTGEAFAVRGDDVMPTASRIKLAVMIEAYRQESLGRIDLKVPVTLTEADKVPGSGVLTDHFSDGATLSLRDAVRLMIVFSDNTATNLVLDRIGIRETSETMEKLGWPNTKIHSKVFRRETSRYPERSKRFGLGSTTAEEMIRIMESLNRKELVSREASEAMVDHLQSCVDKDKSPRFLPPGTKIAFKTGSVDDIRTAAGIMETRSGPVALCVLTSGNEDRRYVADNAGNLLCAELARVVFQHFNADATMPLPPSDETRPLSWDS